MIAACAEADTELVVNHSFRFTDKLRRLHQLVWQEEIIGDVRSVSSQFRTELFRNSTHLLDTLVLPA
jgi:predicted dehydrogenase